MHMLAVLEWTICLVGIILNVVVFWKYKTTRKFRHSSIFGTSMQLLLFMSVADTISLLSLAFALSTKYVFRNEQDPRILSIICKADLFAIHSASAFSIWCWLVLSTLRYLAIYKPYLHLRLNLEPRLVAGVTAFACCILELWICFDVTFIKEEMICGETMPEKMVKFFQLGEILWTYFLPLTLITVLDVKVLYVTWDERRRSNFGSFKGNNRKVTVEKFSNKEQCTDSEQRLSDLLPASMTTPTPSCRSFLDVNGFSSSPLTRSTTKGGGQPRIAYLKQQQQNAIKSPRNEGARSDSLINCNANSPYSAISKIKRRAQQIRILRRFFLISIFDLGMNLPNYVIRLYITLASEETLDQYVNTSMTFIWIQEISQILYFTQFALNALYLVMIIYVLPKNTKLSNGNGNHSGASNTAL